MLNLFVFLLLLRISIQDLKTYEVQDRYFILLFALVWITNPYIQLTSLLFGFCFCGFLFLFYKVGMLGGADIKLFFISNFYLNITAFLISVLCSSVLALLFCIVFKRKKIPFIPCISIGIFLAYLL